MTRLPPSVVSCCWPCTRVIPVGRPESSFVAKLPSVATTFGWISSICFQRWPSHAWISSGCGSRFPGGRHLSTFATNTSARVRPIPASSLSSSFPAWPTNGHALLVLVEAGRLADEHQVGLRVARAEHDLRPALARAGTSCNPRRHRRGRRARASRRNLSPRPDGASVAAAAGAAAAAAAAAAEAEAGPLSTPCAAKTENCLRTFAEPQSGQSALAPIGTSSS